MSKSHTEYNEVKRKARKHAELIKAWADGAEIQCQSLNNEWEDVFMPSWYESTVYRIKPTPKPDREIIKYHAVNSAGIVVWPSIHDLDREGYQKVKWTIEGETGRIKAVELLDK